MLILEGRGSTAGTVPLDLQAARGYFADVPAFLRKIELVDGIRALAARPGAYLITHHPVGGLGYHVVLAACLEATWDGDALRLWARFLLDRMPADVPFLVMVPQAGDWVDLIAGTPAPHDFRNLRVARTLVAPDTEIAYDLTGTPHDPAAGLAESTGDASGMGSGVLVTGSVVTAADTRMLLGLTDV